VRRARPAIIPEPEQAPFSTNAPRLAHPRQPRPGRAEDTPPTEIDGKGN
jgi:hypothetical protein